MSTFAYSVSGSQKDYLSGHTTTQALQVQWRC
jgi:hypothetical protein